MRMRIDVARSFERVDKPPITKPPDYTDYPSGDVKVVPITVTPKLTSVIPQDGLAKREADIVAISKEFQGLGEKSLLPPPVNLISKLRIDIAKKFERVDEPSVKQPADHTDYPSGDLRKHALGRVSGFITQEGLMKRKVDIGVGKRGMGNERRLGGLLEEMRRKPSEIKPIKFRPSSGVKPVKNVGFLSAVDKFFIWLNRILGEK